MEKIMLIMTAVATAVGRVAQAGDVGHFNGGLMDIRDYFVPPSAGPYFLVYNYYYFSDRLNNGNGDKVGSENINTPGGPVNVNVNVDLHTYALVPVLAWVSSCDILGGKYGAYIAPTFANNSLGADLSIANRFGGSVNNSSFGVGDMYVQPIWMDWGFSHWDLMTAYGFYAPIGKYNTRTVTLPGGAAVRVDSKNNIGLGFWTQEAQVGVAWYPMTNKATAVTAVGTYEYNGEKRDFNFTPGQLVTLNWGISQFLPLSKDHKLLLEAGPAGYDSWQITDSSGGNAVSDNSRSQVHGVGGELGITYVPWSAFLTFHGFYEYASQSRFQGASLGINFGFKF
jgi:hypothetical protein